LAFSIQALETMSIIILSKRTVWAFMMMAPTRYNMSYDARAYSYGIMWTPARHPRPRPARIHHRDQRAEHRRARADGAAAAELRPQLLARARAAPARDQQHLCLRGVRETVVPARIVPAMRLERSTHISTFSSSMQSGAENSKRIVCLGALPTRNAIDLSVDRF
jgi:hypothetical protein